MAGAVDPALADRFRRDLMALAPELAKEGRIALAVSGGPDSVAMLALAAASMPGRVLAATVDHRIRSESREEAANVAASCAAIGVPHATLAIEIPPGASGNLHAWARQERYTLLKRWAVDEGVDALCTAHHADDQAETFLMRAARGAGVSGLAAVRARTDDSASSRDLNRAERRQDGGHIISVERLPVTLLRPLLRWRRAELRTIATGANLPFVDDPSNVDLRFDRSRFRAWLEAAPWLDTVQVGKAAEHLADAEADLLAISHWLWRQRALPCGDDEAKFDVAELPRGVRRYIARIAIDSVCVANGMPIGGPDHVGNVECLLDALEAGKGATQSRVQASAAGTVWHFREAPPRRSV